MISRVITDKYLHAAFWQRTKHGFLGTGKQILRSTQTETKKQRIARRLRNKVNIRNALSTFERDIDVELYLSKT